MSHIPLFLLAAVLAITGVDSQTSLATLNDPEPNAQCTTPGLMCKNCNQVAACIQNPGGILVQIDVISCPGSCRNGSCVTGEVCNYRPFTCSPGEIGGFPDPYDCTKFHICDGTNTTPVTSKCPANKQTGLQTAYGSDSNSCGYPVQGNSNCIDAPVPRCQNNLDVNVLASDPNVYYICTQNSEGLGPNLFRCPPSLSFNVSTFVCS